MLWPLLQDTCAQHRRFNLKFKLGPRGLSLHAYMWPRDTIARPDSIVCGNHVASSLSKSPARVQATIRSRTLPHTARLGDLGVVHKRIKHIKVYSHPNQRSPSLAALCSSTNTSWPRPSAHCSSHLRELCSNRDHGALRNVATKPLLFCCVLGESRELARACRRQCRAAQ